MEAEQFSPGHTFQKGFDRLTPDFVEEIWEPKKKNHFFESRTSDSAKTLL
jgi:hypothetical protein